MVVLLAEPVMKTLSRSHWHGLFNVCALKKHPLMTCPSLNRAADVPIVLLLLRWVIWPPTAIVAGCTTCTVLSRSRFPLPVPAVPGDVPVGAAHGDAVVGTAAGGATHVTYKGAKTFAE